LADRPPDAGLKTIAEFRKDHARPLRRVCSGSCAVTTPLELFREAAFCDRRQQFKAPVNTRGIGKFTGPREQGPPSGAD